MTENRQANDGGSNLPDIRRRGFIWTLALTAVGRYATLGAADPREERGNEEFGSVDADLTQELVEYANRAGRVNHEKLREAHEDYDNGDIDKQLLDRVTLAWRTGERVAEKEVITLEEDIEAATTLERNPNSDGGEAAVYQVPASVTTLSVQAELTIDSGVVIEFGPGVGMEVTADGRIISEGTADDTVFFTGTVPRRGSWDGVVLDGSDDPENTMAQMVIEYGGREGTAVGFKGPANVEVDNGQAELRNCELRQSGGYGLALNSNSVLVNHEGEGSGSNTYLNNRVAPVNTAMNNVHTLSDDSTYTSDDSELTNGEEYVLTGGSVFGNGADQDTRTMENLGVPYRVEGAEISDITWTIEPGTTLEFTEGREFSISSGARMTFQGTADEPIEFTGVKDQRGWWSGIEVESEDAGNVMEHVVVEYGGDQLGGNLVLEKGAELEIRDSTFRHSAEYGIDTKSEIDPGNTTIKNAENNVYTENADGAARIKTTDPHQLSGTSEFTGNDDDHVFVANRTVNDGEIDGEFSWDDIGVPYRMEGTEHEINDVEFQIQPGGTLEFEESGGIDLQGSTTVSLEGSEDDEITFTGTREERGWWSGLRIGGTDADSNTLRHAVIEYAGNGQGGGLLLEGTTIHVEHCTFRRTDGYGLRVNDNVVVPGSKETANNVYTENSRGAARFQKNSANFLSDSSSFTGNDDDHVYVNDAGISRESVVTWEAIEVPYRLNGGEHEINDYRLVVAPGTTVELEERGWFDVQDDGYLTIEGESDNKIRFTGTYDGGDPHGWWGTFHIESVDENNSLTHTIIENGGSETSPAGDNNGIVRLKNGDLDTMENCTVRKSQTAGLYVGSSSNAPTGVCEANTFEDNKEGGCVFE